ncbi:MAG: ester cyclase [Caldilineaceae bacterium]
MNNGNTRTDRALVEQDTGALVTREPQLCRQVATLLRFEGQNVDPPLAANVLCCDLAQQRAVRGRSAAIRLLHSILVDSFVQRGFQVTATNRYGRHTLTQFRFAGVQHRRLLGIPATHRRVTLVASVTATVEDGEIVQVVLDYDVRELLSQLGMTGDDKVNG